MNRQSRLEDYLAMLNCHFNWNLDVTSSALHINCDVNMLEDKLLTDIRGNPPVTCKAYLLLAFVYTVGDSNKKVDFNKALKFIETAEAHVKSNGDKYLVIANKLWILKAKRDAKHTQSLISSLKEIDEQLTNCDKSDICTAEAFSLSRFTIEGYRRALDKYNEAITLNPKNAEAHFGAGFMLGRLRRMDHGPVCKPSPQELSAYQKSIGLCSKNPYPFVFYALSLSDRLKSKDCVIKETTVKEMDRYMKLAMSKSEPFCSGSGIIFKWCAKGYRRICNSGKGKMPKRQFVYFLSREKECVERAVELSPSDTSVLHEAGLFYWRVKSHRNIDKAEAFLLKSVDCSLFRSNFWADMDLVQLRKQFREDYDVLCGYSSLETKYSSRADYMSQLHMYIAVEYEHKREYENARQEYFKSLSYEPNCQRSPQTAKRLPELTKQFVDESAYLFNNDNNHKSAYIEDLNEAGEIYMMFEPEKLREAKAVYELSVELDGKNPDVRLSLCHILLKMKLYDQCISKAAGLDQIESDEILSHAYYRKAVENSNDIEMEQCSRSAIQQESSLADDACLAPIDPFKPRACDFILPEKIHLLLLSAKLGSYDGASMFIQALLSRVFPVHGHYRSSLEMYESFAAIENALKNTSVSEMIKSVLNLDTSSNALSLVRDSRYRMTLSQASDNLDELLAVATIQEYKNALDRIANEFVKLNSKEESGRKSKQPQCYFVYLKHNKKSDKLGNATEKDFITSRRLLGEKIEKNWHIRDFIDTFHDLLQFLSYRTPVYDREYGFVAEFCAKVNVHKHEADITQSMHLYYLAHRAAEFAEEVVLEFSQNMKA